MTTEIAKHFDNHYTSHSDISNRNANKYKEHSPLTGALLNCSVPQKGPMEIALEKKYTSLTRPTLDSYKKVALGECPYSKYNDADEYPEINKRIERDFTIFNTLYANNLTTTQKTSDLIPVLANKTVTCPSGYIPYVFEYEMYDADDSLKHLRVCLEPTRVRHVNFSDIDDYSLSRYIENNTDLPCETNVCNTNYSSFLGHNLEPEPQFSVRKKKNKRSTVDIILGVFLGLALLTIFILVYIYHVKISPKLKMNKEINRIVKKQK